jgi:Holliday junction resolvase RusA-like endonuclease
MIVLLEPSTVALKLNFTLSGDIVPKARPRMSQRQVEGKTKSITYMPQNYVKWKNSAIAVLAEQKLHYLLDMPIDYFKISILIKGNQNRNSDLDNIAGSILDALVQSRVIANDNLNHVDSQVFKFIPSYKTVKTYITIYPVKRQHLTGYVKL